MDMEILIPTVLSIISIVGGIINFFYTRKQDKIGLMFQNWQVYFEENKEKIRQQEKITDNIFNKLNSRAGLIPYFNIILDDSKIKEKDEKIYLGISLINIGKESATNVGICLTEERKEVIVEGYDKNQDGYIVYNYLDSADIQKFGLDFRDLISCYQEDSNGLISLENVAILTNSLCGDVIIPSNCDTIAIGSPIDIGIDRLVVPPSVKKVMGECKLSKPIEIYMSKKLPGEVKNKICKSLIAERKYCKHIKFY